MTEEKRISNFYLRAWKSNGGNFQQFSMENWWQCIYIFCNRLFVIYVHLMITNWLMKSRLEIYNGNRVQWWKIRADWGEIVDDDRICSSINQNRIQQQLLQTTYYQIISDRFCWTIEAELISEQMLSTTIPDYAHQFDYADRWL